MTALPDELMNRVLWSIPNVLCLVGSRSGDEWNAMTTSWVTQVAMEPVLVGVGVDQSALTHRLIADLQNGMRYEKRPLAVLRLIQSVASDRLSK